LQLDQVRTAIINEDISYPLAQLYGSDPVILAGRRQRFLDALDSYEKIYGASGDIAVFSVPGRTEICGNHTDHNAGLVLAASVDLDIIAVVSENNANIVNIRSEGFEQDSVSLSSLQPLASERFRPASLIRGICAGFALSGCMPGGFNAYTTSDVLKGSGLSSSAAFEVMTASVINDLFCEGSYDRIEIARISQRAENEYFGKPCGLMDQIACSEGGLVYIDFGIPDRPVVQRIEYDFSETGHSLVIVDTGGSHADLNGDYAALPAEMKYAAAYFGKETLRDVSMDDIIDDMAGLRKIGNDRAILRAIHYMNENKRVTEQVKALKGNDFKEFLRLVSESGNSSWKLCQNIYSCSDHKKQGLALALAVSSEILGASGACRVHGGGFAGTIQAFVPAKLEDRYLSAMKRIFGDGSCHKLNIRPVGSVRLI
jgi:galactokinase